MVFSEQYSKGPTQDRTNQLRVPLPEGGQSLHIIRTNILSCIAKYITDEIQSVTYLKLYTKIKIEIKHRILLIQFMALPSLYELVNNYQD